MDDELDGELQRAQQDHGHRAPGTDRRFMLAGFVAEAAVLICEGLMGLFREVGSPVLGRALEVIIEFVEPSLVFPRLEPQPFIAGQERRHPEVALVVELQE